MDEKAEWDRREEDRKARYELYQAIEHLEDKIDGRLDSLAERVNELDEFLRGGISGEDPLGTRVHLVETAVTELRILVKGDALGRNSLLEMAKEAIAQAADAKKIAQGKVEVQTTMRGQNVSVVVAIISLIGVIAMAFLTNWDTVSNVFKRETTQKKLERIQREIEEEKRERGPEIQKKLKDIERAARWRG